MTVIAVCSFTTCPETDCHSGPQMLKQFVRTREARRSNNTENGFVTVHGAHVGVRARCLAPQ